MSLKNCVVFQNVDTEIEQADGMVFYKKSEGLYEKVFRSYLCGKVKEEWLVEGMVHYRNNSRDLHLKWN